MLKLPKYVAYCHTCEAFDLAFKRDDARDWARLHKQRRGCADIKLYGVDYIRRKL